MELNKEMKLLKDQKKQLNKTLNILRWSSVLIGAAIFVVNIFLAMQLPSNVSWLSYMTAGYILGWTIRDILSWKERDEIWETAGKLFEEILDDLSSSLLKVDKKSK